MAKNCRKSVYFVEMFTMFRSRYLSECCTILANKMPGKQAGRLSPAFVASVSDEAPRNLVERFDTEFNSDFSAKSPNFRGLVLVCIEANFCIQIRILQHFSRSTKKSHLCTALNSKFQSKIVQLFSRMKNELFNCQDFSIEFCNFEAKLS